MFFISFCFFCVRLFVVSLLRFRAPKFLHSSEGRAANKLLDAFEARDEAEVKKLTQAQVFGFLEAPVRAVCLSLLAVYSYR